MISPHSQAAAAVSGSPVSSSCIATLRGSCCAMRKTPPAAAISPRLTSGSPNWARSSATTRSLANANSVPPPRAVPFTAAIVGLSMK
ncbi:hypothetical protein A5626_19570 [Mycobacterium marseillense]|nr:hypothetical protein A5626_19570 [Mycobacterium marseillense]